MKITSLVVASFLVLLVAPVPAETQQTGKIYRLGILTPAAPPPRPDSRRGYDEAIGMLREIGYVEGQNLVVERRYAEGRPERLRTLAAELVQLRVDALVAVGTLAVQAACEATKSIPIVMGTGGFDPVNQGFVASLARPGGNITGVTLNTGPELIGKRLELFKEVVPKAMPIAVLTTDDAGGRLQIAQVEKAAASLGIKTIGVEVTRRDYERAFAAIKDKRAGALYIGSSPVLSNDRKRIIELAAQQRLPAIYEWSELAEEGGLMSYGANNRALYRRVATFVDRIFKGANPAELPVEQPTQFELTINLKTANALGLTIPQSLLVRANKVIE
jgi:putative ABC transport system substrate-binding protein